jgi:hypothetical protein
MGREKISTHTVQNTVASKCHRTGGEYETLVRSMARWHSAGRGYSKSMSRSRGKPHLVGKLRVRSSNLLGGVPLLGRSLRGVGEGIQSIQRIERAAGHASGAIFLHVDEVSPI